MNNPKLKTALVLSGFDLQKPIEVYLVDDKASLRAFLKAFPLTETAAKIYQFRSKINEGRKMIFLEQSVAASPIEPPCFIYSRKDEFHPSNFYFADPRNENE